MIYLHTGVPGAGKTLFTLAHLREVAANEHRPVFYNGIELLKPEEFPNWQELASPEDWHTCPPGSIVVLDEAQRAFRPRGNGAAVPKHVEALETHRHGGIDLYVITQHPMLVDNNLRRLVGVHRHVVRPFGVPFATVHEFEGVKEQVERSRTGSLERRFAYPKNLYGAYKSAEIHTHKSRIPARVWLLFAVPLLLGGCAYWLYTWWAERLTGEHAKTQIVGAGTAAGGGGGVGQHGDKPKRTTADWIAEQQPRIAGLAYSAPTYDDVTKPTEAPFPAACIKSADRCRCYSQQATVLDVPSDLCGQIVARGFFVAWKRPVERPAAYGQGGGRGATGDLPVMEAGGSGPVTETWRPGGHIGPGRPHSVMEKG